MSNIDFTDLKVVIVNWGRPEDTIECVKSLLNAGIPAGDILVIDNGSPDNSVEVIKNTCPDVEIQCIGREPGIYGWI